MEAVKNKWLWGIFISILSIFAMSHNVKAADLSFNLNNYEKVHYFQQLDNLLCRANTGNISGSTFCDIPPLSSSPSTLFTDVYGVIFNLPGNFKKNDLIEYYLTISTKGNNTLNGGDFSIKNYWTLNNSIFETVSVEVVDDTIIQELNLSYDNSQEGFINSISSSNKPRLSKTYRVLVRVIKDVDGLAGLGFQTTNNNLPIFRFVNLENIPVVRILISNLSQYRFIGSEENREQEEKTQGAVDDSQEAGGDSSTDAQTGTTGLISAIGSAVNVIASASPTNCKINGNMGNLDMGQLDLCANPAPAFIQTIGSLLLILMCVPLAISLFNRFISLFRSFQS